MTLPPERPTSSTSESVPLNSQPLDLIDVSLEIKRQAQTMLFTAKSQMHKAQQLTEAHHQLGQEHWHPRGPTLALLEQQAFTDFEQLLGIINGTASSNYGGEVTIKQWRSLQNKFTR